MSDGHLIFFAGLLLVAGVLASLVAGRLRIPSLLLFLGLGMAIGSDGLNLIYFDNYELAQEIGIVALALILFEGGLSSSFTEIKPVLKPALSIATIGTLITALVVGFAADLLSNLTLLEGLLLGAITASTDGAAVFALMRNSSLRTRLSRTLEGESGFNDPVAVLLVIGFIEWITKPNYGITDMLVLLVQQFGIGAMVGLAVSWLMVRGLRRVQLETSGLYPVASIGTAALAFGGADLLGGSGFLAVYLAGLTLGSSTLHSKKFIATFHQGLAWIAQLTLFLVLGLLVFPAELPGVAGYGTVLALVLVFVARPIAVLVSTLGCGFNRSELTLLGWAGMRGAVPVVLATFAVIADVPHSNVFFNVAFFAVLLSTLLQGATFEPLAKILGVTSRNT